MSEQQKIKLDILFQLRHLCARCLVGDSHNCPVQEIAKNIGRLQGVPLMVNSEFKGLLCLTGYKHSVPYN